MMTKDFKRGKMRMPLRVTLRRLAGFWFLLAVVALIPVFLWLLSRGGGSERFFGLVEADSESVGSVDTARIVSIEVQPGQRVQPGDVLVRLDSTAQTLDMAVQESRLLEYEQNALRHRQTLLESERRCRQIVQEAAVALEAERMNRARDEAELAGLKAEMDRLRPLIEKRLVSEIELSSLRPKALALEKTVGGYAPLIEALQSRHAQAREDLREVQDLLASSSAAGGASDPAAESLRAAVESLRQSSNREPMVLRATKAGVVSRIQYRAGDVVVGGEAIVRVSAERARTISGMLTQGQLLEVAAGDRLDACRAADPDKRVAPVRVVSIDPEVMDLLDPFNPTPQFPLRGRRVRMEILDEAVVWLPGETVVLQRPRWTFPWPWRKPST